MIAAHVGGVPVEESLATLGPLATAIVGAGVAYGSHHLRRLRRRVVPRATRRVARRSGS